MAQIHQIDGPKPILGQGEDKNLSGLASKLEALLEKVIDREMIR